MKRSLKHANIPVFIPHLGCPNMCVFCNQRSISGVNFFDPSSVKVTIDEALSTIDEECETEIAFFGGSFTGIDRNLMIYLLKIAKSYVDSGRVSSIRCSTRPDYIDDEILDILSSFGVKTIELGLQSISDPVLCACKRGHTSKDAEIACEKIVSRGFNLVGQMMIGLPESTPEDELSTAEFIIRCGANAARIYPTVVFRDTELSSMLEAGTYTPLSIEDAVSRSAKVLALFYNSGVNVIRIGLCASESLTDKSKYHAGPNHPALGELIESRVLYEMIKERILMLGGTSGKRITVTVARESISKAIGQKRENKFRLINELGLADISFRGSDDFSGYEFTID